MTVPTAQEGDASSWDEKTRAMRTSVLIHPETAHDGRFMVLPHPRTSVPTYYLHSDLADSSTASTNGGEIFELSTLKDTKFDRSWMISRLNQVISSGQLEIMSRMDVRFLVTSLLYCTLGDGKFRSLEDTFEQIALALHGNRSAEMIDSNPALKTKLGESGAADRAMDSMQQEWTDINTFGNLPIVKDALKEVADVQDLPNGEQAYRLSTAKFFSILDSKHARLSLKSTFVASPNMLGRNFERRWQSDSDPSAYLAASADEEEDADCKEAKELRGKIAAEIIVTKLPPQLATEYFAHLGIASET